MMINIDNLEMPQEFSENLKSRVKNRINANFHENEGVYTVRFYAKGGDRGVFWWVAVVIFEGNYACEYLSLQVIGKHDNAHISVIRLEEK
jgi:hypothetical protein